MNSCKRYECSDVFQGDPEAMSPKNEYSVQLHLQLKVAFIAESWQVAMMKMNVA